MTVDVDDIVVILGAIGVLITTIFTAWTSFKTRETNDDQSKKLDNITVLVDGRYGEVLQQLADMKQLFALKTGLPDDVRRAVEAQDAADSQQARLVKARVLEPGKAEKP